MATLVQRFDSDLLPKVQGCSSSFQNLRVSNAISEGSIKNHSATIQIWAMLLECWGQVKRAELQHPILEHINPLKKAPDFNHDCASEILDSLRLPGAKKSKDMTESDRKSTSSIHEKAKIDIFKPKPVLPGVVDEYAVAHTDAEVDAIIASIVERMETLLGKIQVGHKPLVNALYNEMLKVQDTESQGALVHAEFNCNLKSFQEALAKYKEDSTNPNGHHYDHFNILSGSRVDAGDKVPEGVGKQDTGVRHNYRNFTYIGSTGRAGNEYSRD